MMRTLPLLLLLSAPVAAAEPPAPPTAAITTDCINNRDMRVRRQSAKSGYYVQTRQGWWRNPGNNCPIFRPNAIITTFSTMNRLCRGDVVQIIEQLSLVPMGSCALDAWEKVDGPPADAR